MHGQGKSNVYGALPFSYLAGSDNPHSGVGLRKEGVYGSRDDVSDIYANRSNTRMVQPAVRDSGLGRSNHSTGERGWLPPAAPAGGDPETGIGYDNTGHSELDFGSNVRMAPASSNFILKKAPTDPLRSAPIVRSPTPPLEDVKGEPISSDFYDPPPLAKNTNIDDDGSGMVDDLERIPKQRPTIFSLAHESDKENNKDNAFSSGLSGYPSYVKDPNTRPSTSSDEFNTMIRTDSYVESQKEQRKCSMCHVIIIVVVTVVLCLGIGFVVGWFGFRAMNTPASDTTSTTVSAVLNGGNGATTTPSMLPTTTTTTTTTTTPAPAALSTTTTIPQPTTA